MELRIEPYRSPDAILFNYDELKKEVLAKVAEYEKLVYTEDQVQAAKADRAKLNRLKKALNDERIRREKEYMQPFAEFKAQVKELCGIIDKAADSVDQQVKGFEEKKQQEKMDAIREYWESCTLPADIELKQVFDLKWLNASVSMKSIQEAIAAKLEQVEKDLAIVRNLPLYAFEAEQAYLYALNLGDAISASQRLQEYAEKRAALELAKQKEAEAAKQQQPEPEAQEEAEPNRQWVRFAAYMSVDEATALKEFLESNQIAYKAV